MLKTIFWNKDEARLQAGKQDICQSYF